MKCDKCGNDIFLSSYKEILNGKEITVCGKCRDMKCFICGKTRSKDGVTKWSFETNKETGEIVTIGSCCTVVFGKMDVFKMYMDKCDNMRKNDPESYNKLMSEPSKQELQVKKAFNANPDGFIDAFSRSKKKVR